MRGYCLSSRPQLSWMIIAAPWMGFPLSSYSVTLLSYLLSSHIWSMSCSKLCLVACGLGALGYSTTLMVLPHPTSGALILLTAPSPLLEHGSHTHFPPPALGVTYQHTTLFLDRGPSLWGTLPFVSGSLSLLGSVHLPVPKGFPDFLYLLLPSPFNFNHLFLICPI